VRLSLSLFLVRNHPINLSAISVSRKSLSSRKRLDLSGCESLDETKRRRFRKERGKGRVELALRPSHKFVTFEKIIVDYFRSRQDRNRECGFVFIRAIRLKFVICSGMTTLPLPALMFPLVSRGRNCNGFSISVSISGNDPISDLSPLPRAKFATNLPLSVFFFFPFSMSRINFIYHYHLIQLSAKKMKTFEFFYFCILFLVEKLSASVSRFLNRVDRVNADINCT